MTTIIVRQFVLFSLMVCALTLNSLSAQIRNLDVLQVKISYEALDFDAAVQTGIQLLKTEEGLLPEELAFLHEYLGLSYYQLGQTANAERQFQSLLSLRPDYQANPENISPKIVTFIQSLQSRPQAVAGEQSPEAFTRYLLVNDRRPSAAWRSLLLPGWGQLYKHQKGRAYLLGGVFWAALTGTGVSYLIEQRKEDDYLAATESSKITSAYDSYNSAHKLRLTMGYTALALWLVNIADANWSPYQSAAFTLRAEKADEVRLTLTLMR